MDSSLFVTEALGHVLAVVAFVAAAVYATVRRRRLRRVVRQATIMYWLIIVVSILFAGINLLWIFVPISAAMPWLDLLSEYGAIIGQAIIVIALISLRIIVERLEPQPRRILAIGAHPDDIEIGCGATLAQALDAGHTVWGLVMTRGERGGDAEERPTEALSSARFLGMAQIRVLDFPDTRLSEHIAEIRDAIEGEIQEVHPDIILTHSSHDLHQDHRAVHEATLQAARRIQTILCYESPSATSEFQPVLFVDIGDYIDVKVESIKEHWDQRAKPYVQEERVRGVAIFRGGQARCQYAEGFEVVRANLHLEDVR